MAAPAPKEEPEVEEEKEETPKEVTSAFSINEDDIGKGDLGYVSDDEEIENALQAICDIYYNQKDENLRKKIIEKISVYFVEMFNDQIEESIKMIARIFKKKSLSDAVIQEFLENNSCSVNNQFLKLLLTSDNYYTTFVIKGLKKDDENNDVIFDIDTSIIKTKTDKVVVTPNTVACTIDCDEILNGLGITINDPSDETVVAQDSEIDYFDSEHAEGFDFVNAETVSKKDLFSSEKKGKAIVIKNDNGNYLTIDGKIIGIDCIDDRNVKDITIVPKDWYNDTMEILDNVKKAPTGAVPEEEIEEEEASGEEE